MVSASNHSSVGAPALLLGSPIPLYAVEQLKQVYERISAKIVPVTGPVTIPALEHVNPLDALAASKAVAGLAALIVEKHLKQGGRGTGPHIVFALATQILDSAIALIQVRLLRAGMTIEKTSTHTPGNGGPVN